MRCVLRLIMRRAVRMHTQICSQQIAVRSLCSPHLILDSTEEQLSPALASHIRGHEQQLIRSERPPPQAVLEHDSPLTFRSSGTGTAAPIWCETPGSHAVDDADAIAHPALSSPPAGRLSSTASAKSHHINPRHPGIGRRQCSYVQ